MLKAVVTIPKLRIQSLFLKCDCIYYLSLSCSSSDFVHVFYIKLLPICIHCFLQIDGVPGLAVTLFSLLLQLHKDEEMARNSVDEVVCQAIRQQIHDSRERNNLELLCIIFFM